MIQATFGLTKTPFQREDLSLLPQQQRIAEIIQIHAQQGGFSVLIGEPGVGKTVLRKHIEALANGRDTVVASISRTLHTYTNVLRQLCAAMHIEQPGQAHIENALITAAQALKREGKTLYTLIDEAHLLETSVLRKLRLLFGRFAKNHNLVLLGQPSLMHALALRINADLKSRVTYSATLYRLNDQDMADYIQAELDAVRLGANTFDEAAVELILRSVEGNLRLCANLCYTSLIHACRDGQRRVATSHVNDVLVQPHWRSQEQLIQQQVKATEASV